MVKDLNYDKKDSVIETAYRDNQNRQLSYKLSKASL